MSYFSGFAGRPVSVYEFLKMNDCFVFSSRYKALSGSLRFRSLPGHLNNSYGRWTRARRAFKNIAMIADIVDRIKPIFEFD